MIMGAEVEEEVEGVDEGGDGSSQTVFSVDNSSSSSDSRFCSMLWGSLAVAIATLGDVVGCGRVGEGSPGCLGGVGGR